MTWFSYGRWNLEQGVPRVLKASLTEVNYLLGCVVTEPGHQQQGLEQVHAAVAGSSYAMREYMNTSCSRRPQVPLRAPAPE